MDCKRSFFVDIDVQKTYATLGTNIKTWPAVSHNFWQIIDFNTGSNLILQGFKRIDLYGIEMIGSVYTDVGANDGAIVGDYGMNINITGTNPLVSATFNSAYWPITTQNKFVLTKFQNKVLFDTPITGVTNINFGNFNAQGNGAETLNSVTLELELSFVFYYKYDGE